MLRVDGLEASTQRFGVSEFVLSRGLTRFQRFDLQRLPADKRRAALSLQLQQWSPFATSDFAVAWHEGTASVWCWDRMAVNGLLQGRAQASSQRIVPESLLRGVLQDGLRLVTCLDGFEAQHWLAGQLVHSRWWSSQPSIQEWVAFQRESSISPSAQRRDVQIEKPELQRSPWVAFEALNDRQVGLAFSEGLIYTALVGALGAATLGLGITQWRLGNAVHAKQEEIAQLRAGSKLVLDARETALSAQARLHVIRGLQRFSDPLPLMVAVSQALAGTDAVVTEWDMSDGRLRILVSSATSELSGANFVGALQASGRFGDIKVVTQADPKQMAFIMDLLTRDALAAGSAVARTSSPES